MINQTIKKQNLIGVKRIGDYSYVLTDEIGRGYSSTVYIGKDVRTNQSVAIKVVDMRKLDQQVHKQLLNSQIACLRNFRYSKYILNLIDVISTVNNTYIITEYCEGKDLAKLIRAKKRISQQETINIMKQLISGYTELYSYGIIHRDLKPANIFFKNGIAKIADFGFAIKQIQSSKWKQYNLGSPTYMSPEVLKQNKYSFKSDIWALGIILFEMLHGIPPWKTKSDAALYKKMTQQAIQSIVNPTLANANMVNFMKKCCCVDINSRMNGQQLRDYEWKHNLNQINIDNIINNLNNNNYPLQVTPQNMQNITRPHSVIIPNNNTPKYSQELISPYNFRYTQKIQTTQLSKSPSKRQTRMNSDILGKFKNIQKNNQNANIVLPKSPSLAKIDPFTHDHSHLIKWENIQIQKAQNAQKSLLAQIHYCRFIFMILSELQKQKQVNKFWTQNLKKYLKAQLYAKINMLHRTVTQDKNYFKIIGFQILVSSKLYSKLRQTILKYYGKYMQKIGIQNNDVEQNCLRQWIREYNKQISNLGLLQKIINLYQIKQLQKKIDYNDFGEKTKIEFLVGCKAVLNIQRLRNNISILGI